MSSVKVSGSATGTANFTIIAPSGTSTDRTLTLPDEAGTVLTSVSNLTGMTGLPTGKTLLATHGVNQTSFSSFTVSHSDHDSGHDVLTKTFTPSSSSSLLVISFMIGAYRGGSNKPGFDPILYINGSEASGVDNSSHFGAWYNFHRSQIDLTSYHNLYGTKAYIYNSSASCTVTIKVRVYDENSGATINLGNSNGTSAQLTILEFGNG